MVYTIVFHKLEIVEGQILEIHPPITKTNTLLKTKETANAILGNAFNDLSLTREFIKREEYDKLVCQVEQFIKKEDFGRDHHPRCFSLWMAGGGIKGGPRSVC